VALTEANRRRSPAAVRAGKQKGFERVWIDSGVVERKHLSLQTMGWDTGEGTGHSGTAPLKDK
jgi:hypothetical protein